MGQKFVAAALLHNHSKQGNRILSEAKHVPSYADEKREDYPFILPSSLHHYTRYHPEYSTKDRYRTRHKPLHIPEYTTVYKYIYVTSSHYASQIPGEMQWKIDRKGNVEIDNPGDLKIKNPARG